MKTHRLSAVSYTHLDVYKRQAPSANKVEIKNAVEELYGVTVKSVNTINYSGKLKSRYTKAGVIKGKTPAFKKAIITLKEGESIDFFSNI